MKRICLVFSLVFLFTVPSKAQLRWPAMSNYPDSYVCKATGEIIYPSLGLKAGNDYDLFYQDKLIYSKSSIPDGYSSICYEIFNDTIVFVTFVKEYQSGIAVPYFIKREEVHIICLSAPDTIYKVQLNKRKIYESSESLLRRFEQNYMPLCEYYNYYFISDFDRKYLTLINCRNQIEKIEVNAPVPPTKEFNLILIYNDEIDSRPIFNFNLNLVLKRSDMTEEIIPARYIQGRLTLTEFNYNKLLQDSSDTIYLSFRIYESINRKKKIVFEYEIKFNKLLFHVDCIILRVYNLEHKRYKKRFSPLSSTKNYNYEYEYENL